MLMYGFDVGGTKIEIKIFDSEMNVLDSWRVPTPTNDYSVFISTVQQMVAKADKKFSDRSSVGIGLPGVIDKEGRVTTVNIPCLCGKQLLKDLVQTLNRNVGLVNDVRAFALSEAMARENYHSETVLGVVLGTGVAAGLCINGQIHLGKAAVAGEIGHSCIHATLQQKYQFPIQQCNCGLLGCYEKYLSGSGLLFISQHLGFDYVNTRDIVNDLNCDNPNAKEVISCYLDCLGQFLAQQVLAFDPDVIVLGGGLSNIDFLYKEIPHYIEQYLFGDLKSPQILPPQHGDSSGVRGAALAGRVENN
ncbi:ROK family protein [Parashewanella curva]|uniref:N-acetylglucosamine kinase n=1 Tax=Parashewanella curva TaxID=2338552 RepID=A0A3L8Q0I9_9GAMM|nr:ROK family protein [Parashewanella curva]RLV61085.1 ROK family protein [Parashewanella curva]